MYFRKTARCLAVATALWVSGGANAQASDLVEVVQNHLYAGKTDAALAVAQHRLAAAPNDEQARFALGTVQFLQAIESIGQSFHQYGLQTKNSFFWGPQNLVPENPRPDRLTYEALREILARFVVDLDRAENTLGEITDQPVEFPLNIGLVHLDLDADGVATDDEAFWQIFKLFADFPWLDEESAGDLLVDFDQSDAPWLQGYSHLLMAITEFLLAHDWQNLFNATFHNLFPGANIQSAVAERDRRIAAELESFNGRPELPRRMDGEGHKAYGKRYREWRSSPRGRRRFDALVDHGRTSGWADLIAFAHLLNWPVVEPERMTRVLGHLESVSRLSRENWRRILAETDDKNEWVPNPRQSGALPRMQVTDERVAAWHHLLDNADALLAGKKLVPHWRFDRGINLRRMFLEPKQLDAVLLAQGSGALPYLEDGDRVSPDAWDEITQAFGRNFHRYFIWFN